MICPNNSNKDFDDLDCRDCQWYYQCFKMWQDNNIWGKEEPTGDNFPNFIKNGICEKDNMTFYNLGYACDSCPYNKDNFPVKHNPSKINKLRPITQEEVDKFRLELEGITYFDEFWRKFNEN